MNMLLSFCYRLIKCLLSFINLLLSNGLTKPYLMHLTMNHAESVYKVWYSIASCVINPAEKVEWTSPLCTATNRKIKAH